MNKSSVIPAKAGIQISKGIIILIALTAAPVRAAKLCQACPPGQWTKNGTCVSCQEALGDTKYCPGGGISYSCPNNGKTLIATATSSSDCEGWGGGGFSGCDQGQYLKDLDCLPCPAGTYQVQSNHKLKSCMNCGAGQYQNTTGQASCKSCGAWASGGSHTYCPSLPGNGDTSGRVQGYCYGSVSTAGTASYIASSTNGKAWTGSYGGVPGSGSLCHCRAKDQAGVWSSWVFFYSIGSNYYANGYFGCVNICAYECSRGVSLWSSEARW
jgi:hypothetical protein